MCILVDDRAGSNELARHIIPQGKVRLVAGLKTDVLFRGRGPEGWIEVGIEHKRIEDLLQVVRDGRFADNQLPALRECEDRLLLVQGAWRRGGDEGGGLLEIYTTPPGKEKGWYDTGSLGWGREPRLYAEVESWLTTMRVCAGVPHLRCGNYQESGRAIGALWRWWNHKEFDEHRSHLVSDKSHIAPLRGELPFIVRAVAELKGIGPEAAVAAEAKFGSAYRAAMATAEEWAEMKVGGRHGKKARRLGKKAGLEVWEEWRKGGKV